MRQAIMRAMRSASPVRLVRTEGQRMGIEVMPLLHSGDAERLMAARGLS